MLKTNEILTVLEILLKAYPTLPLQEFTKNHPFITLITTILSQRAKDETTLPTAERLFQAVGPTPEALLNMPIENLERIIFQTGFYHQKALRIQQVCQRLIGEFNSEVPRTLEELTSLPGVGRKTANIVLNNCFDIPAIAVDIHVHRITNRMGWVGALVESRKHALDSDRGLKVKSEGSFGYASGQFGNNAKLSAKLQSKLKTGTLDVLETEEKLMEMIPKRKWKIVNHVFVRHGQEVCRPVHPKCEICPVIQFCALGKRLNQDL